MYINLKIIIFYRTYIFFYVAIDIWAAGVILVSFLTGTYPFFVSSSFADAIIELTQVYGRHAMQHRKQMKKKKKLLLSDEFIVRE